MTAIALTFPNYVPEHIRRKATRLRHGEGAESGDDGWAGALARLHVKLNHAEQYLQNASWLSEEARSALYREKRDLTMQIKQAKGDLDCLERLTALPDPDLENIYTLLGKHISDEKQAWSFIYAAISANIEFARHRDAIRAARERKQDIAELAQKLAEQLESFDRTGIQGPDAFWSVRSLLEITDAHETNHIVWRQMRGHILGKHVMQFEKDADFVDEHNQPEYDDSMNLPDEDFIVEETEVGDAAATSEQDRRYAWQVAPSLSDMLNTLTYVAKNFEPSEQHLIGAALNTRQDSVKTSYIRGFAHLLNENGISITPPIMQAMAKTATLALNHKDLIVSYDNVRKAL